MESAETPSDSESPSSVEGVICICHASLLFALPSSVPELVTVGFLLIETPELPIALQ